MMNFVTIINLHILQNNKISSNSIQKLTRGSSLGAVGMFWERKRNKLYQTANTISNIYNYTVALETPTWKIKIWEIANLPSWP